MKNYLQEIEDELKQLGLLNHEQELPEIDALITFLIQENIEHTFYLEGEFDADYFERRCVELFEPNESFVIEYLRVNEEQISLKLLINGEVFQRDFSYDVYDHLSEFFSFLVELNGALKGEFLRVPITFSNYLFFGIYIEDKLKAKNLKRLFDLFSISSEHQSDLSFHSYLAKDEKSLLKHLSCQELESHLSFEGGRNVSLLSPDKKLFFLGCGDGNIYVWNHESKAYEAKLSGHNDHVQTVACHPSKNLLISGACMGDGTLKLWDTKNYKLLKTIGEPTPEDAEIDEDENRRYYHVTFTPDGQYLLAFYTRGDEDNVLELFDAESFSLCSEVPLHVMVEKVAFSTKGELLALYMNEEVGSVIQILSIGEHGIKPFKKFYAELGDGGNLFFSQDGCYLVESTKDKKLQRVWDLEQKKFSLTMHNGYVEPQSNSKVISMALFLEKNLLAIEYSQKIVVWDTLLQKKLIEITDYADVPDEVSFSADGEWVIKHSWDEQSLWSIENGQELQNEEKIEALLKIAPKAIFQKANIESLAISDSLSDVFILQSIYMEEQDESFNSLIFFNTQEKTLTRMVIDDLEHGGSEISLLLDGQFLSMEQSSGLRIWSIESQEELKGETYERFLLDELHINLEEIEQHLSEDELKKLGEKEYPFFSKNLSSFSFNSTGEELAIATEIGVDFWHIPSMSLLGTWEVTDGEYMRHVSGIFYLDHETLALLVGGDLHILSKKTQELKYLFSNVETFTFYEEKNLLAFSTSKKLILFSLLEDEILHQLNLEEEMVTLAFSSDGKLLAGSQNDHYLTVWDVESLNTVHKESSGQNAYCDYYDRLLFTPNGEHLLAFNSFRNEVHIRQLNALFSWRKWSVVKELDAEAVSVSPDGEMLAVVNEEHEAIELFSAKGWRKKKSIHIRWEEASSHALGFSPDGRWIIFLNDKGMVHLYSFENPKQEVTLIAGKKGEWIVMEEEKIRDSGSLQAVPKFLLEKRDD